MKTSHMIYKVDNLDSAVAEYRNKGFEVEYGKLKNPINALIFFSEGPYIELLDGTRMPSFFKKLFRLLGKGKMVDRLDYWDAHPGGWCALALETYASTPEKEIAILKKHNIGYFHTKNRRDDTKGRSLRFQTVGPYELALPFFMTYFNLDPKPKNFIHPNGVKSIGHITFGTRKDLFPIMAELCNDDILELCEGDGIQRVEFNYEHGKDTKPLEM